MITENIFPNYHRFSCKQCSAVGYLTCLFLFFFSFLLLLFLVKVSPASGLLHCTYTASARHETRLPVLRNEDEKLVRDVGTGWLPRETDCELYSLDHVRFRMLLSWLSLDCPKITGLGGSWQHGIQNRKDWSKGKKEGAKEREKKRSRTRRSRVEEDGYYSYCYYYHYYYYYYYYYYLEEEGNRFDMFKKKRRRRSRRSARRRRKLGLLCFQ